MHSEVEAAQPHEIGHLHMVNGRTMVSLLVRNYEVASAGRVTLTPGRTLRAIYRHAVFDESNPLQTERNFDAQLVRRRPTAKKNLRGTPVTSLRGDVQRGHFIALGQLVPASACRKQSAEVLFPTEARCQHQHRETFVSFNVTAERFRREQRQKILIAARWQSRVGIGTTSQERAKKRGVVSSDGIGEQRHILTLRRWSRGMLAEQQLDFA